ncbi:MAG: CBS domain-containing protein [Micropepsaceae bacterium]
MGIHQSVLVDVSRKIKKADRKELHELYRRYTTIRERAGKAIFEPNGGIRPASSEGDQAFPKAALPTAEKGENIAARHDTTSRASSKTFEFPNLKPRGRHSIDWDQASAPGLLTEVKAVFAAPFTVMSLQCTAGVGLMNVGDIMTREVISVSPQTTVADAASLMLRERVSGLPVINSAHALIGIVTEGDFLRRAESGTEKKRPHWMEFIVGPSVLAREYLRSHARQISDVMTHEVVVATEDMPLSQAVDVMERRGVKRLPVVRGGRVVGIVSRANLLHALVANRSEAGQGAADKTIREQLECELAQRPWRPRLFHTVVKDGVVDMWGYIAHEGHREAIRTAAANVTGVKQVRDHLVWFQPHFGIVVTPEPIVATTPSASED